MTPEIHEAADIFPLDDENLPSLADDIKANGLINPIELCGGKIIDGRRRFKACRMAGVEARFKDVNPPDPIAYSWSLNGPRRHLTPSQLAMVGARMRDLYDKAAKERQKRKPGSVPANLPEQKKDARDEVGKVVGVSGKTIDHATKVLKNAVPEVVAAVDEGRMAVSTAAILTTEPPEVQREEATSPMRNRQYKPGNGGGDSPVTAKEERPAKPEGELQGKGVILANEALNCLIRIPKNDALRKRGLQIVTDWIKHNP